ncbi:hypothetical protein [Streptomyces sp. NPDC058108]|uniref:hypothetical protein n=1 Tax=Streptomyces sp. NPDC058108 TaxID=3346344 RepID=UPI0036EB4920
MRIVVAGQGYVGLPLAVRAAEVGHRVVGYDVDPHRVQQLAAGQTGAGELRGQRWHFGWAGRQTRVHWPGCQRWCRSRYAGCHCRAQWPATSTQWCDAIGGRCRW